MHSPAEQHLLDKYINQYALKEHLNENLLRCLRVYQFQPQQTVLAAMAEQTHLYFLVNGKAQVGYFLANGKRSIIMIITPFSVVGDMEFFKDEPLNMNVIATEPSVFLGIQKDDALRYGYDDPRFLRFIIHYMSLKLRISGYHQISYDLPLINRLAIYLLNQPCIEQCVEIESKALVADYLGTTTRHLNRVIKTLEDEGVIQWEKQRVIIKDQSKLQSYGEL